MPYEIFYKYPSSEYGEGILLQEYNGTISLVSAAESKNGGTVFMKWVFPQGKNRQPIEKAIPMKIDLGSPREAVNVLKHFLRQLSKEIND